MEIFNNKKCYTPSKIADILNVHICTVYRMVRSIDDPLPAVRLKSNGQIRIHGLDINKYLENHKVDPLNE